jgi:mannose-6-phosphate isomerase-like protein (cupin superfamily)
MVKIIKAPSIIKATGNMPKEIREHFGRVNSSISEISIAHIISPEGWQESGQTPEFDEYTVVLKGTLKIETRNGIYLLKENQAIMVEKGEWVLYSTPEKGGAEYIAVCLPAFSPDLVHRDIY